MAFCQFCNWKLDAFECWQKGSVVSLFIEHPQHPGVAYYGPLGFKVDGAREYKCPSCKRTLCTNEAEALSFLTLRFEDACEFCGKEKATESIYDELEKREVWICSTCDDEIEWVPASSLHLQKLKGGGIEND